MADLQANTIATSHVYRHDIDGAFHWLDLAYAQRDGQMFWLKVDPLLRNLHGDPRYKEPRIQAIEKALKFPN